MEIKCAGVILFEDNSVLLVRHTKNARLPADAYGFPAGRLDVGETPEQAAVRELRQETGLTTKVEDLQKIDVVHSQLTMASGRKEFFEFHVFYARNYTGKPQVSENATIPEFVSFSKLNKIKVVSDDVRTLPVEVYKKFIAN